MTIKKYKAAIFDLDGVLADTARFHYLAWKDLADQLGIAFSLEEGEHIKGIARMEALDVVLRAGGLQNCFSSEEKVRMADEKNALYVSYITKLDQNALLPGALDTLKELRRRGVKIALGSASKNARIILEGTGILPLFDSISDGTRVQKAKPDPEVFLLAARDLSLDAGECVVFEDAFSGVEAAHNGGMYAVGIGTRENLPNADTVVANLSEWNPDDLFLTDQPV